MILWFAPISFPPMNRKSFIIQYFYPIVLLLIIWHVKGNIYTFDFNDQIRLIENHTYEKAHPVIYTLLIKSILILFASPSAIIPLQIMAAWGICGFVVYFFCRMDVSWVYPFACNTIIIYFNNDILITASKDAFYYLFFILLVIGLCSWSIRKGKVSLYSIIAGLCGVALFRYDGQLVVVITSFFLLVSMIRYKRNLKWHVALLSLPVFCMILCHVVMPYALDSQPGRVGVGTKYAMPAELICEVLVHGGDLTSKEKIRISEIIMPEEVIRERHSLLNEYNGEKYIWYVPPPEEREKLQYFPYDYGFNHILSNKGKEIFELFIPIALRNPGIIFRHLWDQSYLLTSLKTYASIFFYMSLFAAVILLIRLKSIHPILPFIPIWTVAIFFIAVVTTCEIRYVTPITAGGVIVYLYSYALIRRMCFTKKMSNEGCF